MARDRCATSRSLAFWDLLIGDAQRAPRPTIARARGARAAHGLLDRAVRRTSESPRFRRRPDDEPAQRPLRAPARLALRAAVRDGLDAHGGGCARGRRVGGAPTRSSSPRRPIPRRSSPTGRGLDAAALARLGASPIVICTCGSEPRRDGRAVRRGWDTPLQWIFDRRRAAGIDRGQLLTCRSPRRRSGSARAAASCARVRARVRRAVPAAARPRAHFFALSDPAATFRQYPARARCGGAVTPPIGVRGGRVDRHGLAGHDGERVQRDRGRGARCARRRVAAHAEAA